MHRAKLTTLTTMAILPLAVACGGTKVSADSFGDLTYKLQSRPRPDADRLGSCGNGALTDYGKTAIRRRPYLQQVTDHSALVVLRTTDPEALVEVTLPDGTPVVSASANQDTSAAVDDGSWQGIAAIDGLEPSTLYCYEVQGLTQKTGFRTAPAPGSGQTVHFLAFGDSGSGTSTEYEVRDQMLTVPFDFIVHTGDVAYDSGTMSQLERGFFDAYASMLDEFPAFPIAGNHDHVTEDALPFRQAFVLPEDGAPDGIESWYSFDWGDLHFVGVDTERIGPVQADWLDRDLAQSDRPWKIVFGHRPPFSSGEHGSDPSFDQWFVPVIQKHHVQLVLSGHDHDYERTKPIDGTTYIVTGGGGEGTRPVSSLIFTAFSEETLNFVDVEVQPDQLTLHAIDGTGVEFDSARIYR